MAVIKIEKPIVNVYVDSSQESKGDGVIVTDVTLPDDAPARVKTLRAENKKWYLTVTYHPDSDRPFALFCYTNHPEKTAHTSDAVEKLINLARKEGILEEHISKMEDKIKNDNNVSKLTRTISLLLRHRVPIRKIVSVIDSVEDVYVGSFLFQIKKFLSQYIKEGEKVEGQSCYDCGGSNLQYSEGCMMCMDCGSSKCG